MRQVFVFAETDLDLIKSINANQDVMIETIGLDLLQFFKAISFDLMNEYKELKKLLKVN